MFEHRTAPLLPFNQFLIRLCRHGGLALILLVGSLGIGTAGYVWLADKSPLDGFLNAAMLLGGMGPVGDIQPSAGKIFAALYALYAGLVYLLTAGILLSPFVHRILHKFHLEEEEA